MDHSVKSKADTSLTGVQEIFLLPIQLTDTEVGTHPSQLIPEHWCLKIAPLLRTGLSHFGGIKLDQCVIVVSGNNAGACGQGTRCSEPVLGDSFQVFSLSSPQSFIDDTLPCKIKQNQKAL